MIAEPLVASTARTIESSDELAETRLEAVGFVFHGINPVKVARAVRAGSNLLHFARCPKLDRASRDPNVLWYPTIRTATGHLNEEYGSSRWQWCKHCQQEVTQRMLDE
jgi:hypothetical protein